MKCLNCGDNEAIGRSKYCSDKCKVAWNRNKKRNNTEASVTVGPPTVTASVTPKPANFGQPIDKETVTCFKPNCMCLRCQQNRSVTASTIKLVINEVNRVSLPGDVDYKGVGQPKGVQWVM